jgi:hypothetical protein
MPDHVVDIADDVVTSAVMSDGDSEVRAAKSNGKRFFTIRRRQ